MPVCEGCRRKGKTRGIRSFQLNIVSHTYSFNQMKIEYLIIGKKTLVGLKCVLNEFFSLHILVLSLCFVYIRTEIHNAVGRCMLLYDFGRNSK